MVELSSQLIVSHPFSDIEIVELASGVLSTIPEAVSMGSQECEVISRVHQVEMSKSSVSL